MLCGVVVVVVVAVVVAAVAVTAAAAVVVVVDVVVAVDVLQSCKSSLAPVPRCSSEDRACISPDTVLALSPGEPSLGSLALS